ADGCDQCELLRRARPPLLHRDEVPAVGEGRAGGALDPHRTTVIGRALRRASRLGDRDVVRRPGYREPFGSRRPRLPGAARARVWRAPASASPARASPLSADPEEARAEHDADQAGDRVVVRDLIEAVQQDQDGHAVSHERGHRALLRAIQYTDDRIVYITEMLLPLA